MKFVRSVSAIQQIATILVLTERIYSCLIIFTKSVTRGASLRSVYPHFMARDLGEFSIYTTLLASSFTPGRDTRPLYVSTPDVGLFTYLSVHCSLWLAWIYSTDVPERRSDFSLKTHLDRDTSSFAL